MVFSFLFTPHQETLNTWEGLKTELSNKPPFGYFTIYKNGIDGIRTSTTTQAYQLADLSGLSDFFTPLRAMLIMILYVSFGFAIFKRLKYLDL